MYSKNIIRVNGMDVEYYKVNHDINGNPRYVIHFLDIADSYKDAAKIAREKLGGKKYRAKWYGGGIVFSSYNLKADLQEVIRDD